MPHRYEVYTPDGWRAIAFEALTPGALYRRFDTETARLVEDEDGVWRWRALAAPVGDTIEAEPVPETEAERQVRERGMFWPGVQTGREGFTPGRLR